MIIVPEVMGFFFVQPKLLGSREQKMESEATQELERLLKRDCGAELQLVAIRKQT